MYEALAAFLRACRSTGLEKPLRESCRVVIFNDNTNAVARATSAMVHAPTEATPVLHGALAALRDSYGVHVEFRHLRRISKEVSLADAMGRWNVGEWFVRPDVLAPAVQRALQNLPVAAGQAAVWPPDIHLFGFERTCPHECAVYYSVRWDRHCASGTVWDMDWGKWPEVALRGQLQVFGVSPPKHSSGRETREEPGAPHGSQDWERKPVCYAFPHSHRDAYHTLRKIELHLATVWLVLRRDLSIPEAFLLKRLPVKTSVPLQPVAPGTSVVASPEHIPKAWRPALDLHFICWDS